MRSICAVTMLLALAPLFAQAQSSDRCDVALQPTLDQGKSDYRLMQSFMKLHASEEYTRIHNITTDARNADASYMTFSAEYEDSHSKDEFQEKITKRLENEHFTLDVSDAKSYYRGGVLKFV